MKEVEIKKISKICGVPVSVYNNQILMFQYPDYNELIISAEMFKTVEKAISNHKVPFLILEDENIFFGAMESRQNQWIILGPVSRKTVSEALQLEYCHRHHLGQDFILKRMEMKTLAEVLSYFTYLDTGQELDSELIQIATVNEAAFQWNSEADQEEYQLEQSEIEWDHNSIEYEHHMLKIVREGDIEAMKKIIHGIDDLGAEHIGIVAEKATKQAEYLIVTLIALISRTAVEGGMSNEKAYGLADIYLRRLEKIKSVSEMYFLASKAQYEFTLNVRQAKEEKSNVLYVEQCKEYIAKNLRKPIQVGDIASVIGFNRSYLSRRFSEVEGITIQKYIMRERCIHAANMLKFSNYSISIIAEYFCFSSQSHFGKIFREFYEMTPKEYRNKYQRTIVF